YGRRNAGTVQRGTGETLLGRGLGPAQRAPQGVGAGHSTAGGRGTTEPRPKGRSGSRTTPRKELRSVRVQATNPPLERTTELQSKLYQAAKRDPRRRFHALYDRLSLSYVLQTAWELVRKNRGAAGIDQQTLEQIEALGVGVFLAEIAQALREKSYRPQPVRRVAIPKGDGRTRP